MGFILYYFTGWTEFTMNYNQNFVTKCDVSDVYKLKFKDCIYTVKDINGENAKTRDVSSQLELMVSAFKGNTNDMYKFQLDEDGLSMYSFIIKGFNDAASIKATNEDVNWVGTSNVLNGEKWNGTTNVTLVGKYKLI